MGGRPGRGGFQLGLRGRLVTLVLVVLAPLLVLQAAHLTHTYRRHIEDELQARRELASSVVSAFSHHLHGIWNSAAALGGVIAGTRPHPDPAAIEAVLQASLADHPTVRALAWLGPDGRVLATTDPSLRGTDLGAAPVIRRVRDGTRRALSDLSTEPGTGLPTFALALGAGPPDRLAGILVAWVEPAALVRVLPLPRRPLTRSSRDSSTGIPVDKRFSANLRCDLLCTFGSS